MALGILIGFTVIGLVWYLTKENIFNHPEDIFMMMVVSVLIGIILTAIMPEFFVEDVTVSRKLSTLQDGYNTRGEFFLGSGVIDDRQVFSYYEYDGGVYRLKTVDASAAGVVEYDGVPRVDQLCANYTSIPDWVDFPMNLFTPDKECFGRITFYVPPGSVTNGYLLDAKN